jgi:hypothetical protein
VLSGLTNGTAYTFTATAANDSGTSTSSAASNAVTPAAPAVAVSESGPAPLVPKNLPVTTLRRVQTATVIKTKVKAPVSGKLVQVGTVPSGSKAKAKTMQVCKATRTVKKQGDVAMKCSLTKKARQMLAKKPLRVTIVSTLTGSDGQPYTSTMRVVVRSSSLRQRPARYALTSKNSTKW